MKILHLCLANFYIDNYSYQENMLPKYHKIMGHDVAVIASLVSFNINGERCLLKTAEEYICRDGYKVIRLNYRKHFVRLNTILRRYENTYSTIEQYGPNIIFIHSPQFWDIYKVVKYLISHKKVKVFVDNHGDFINSGSNWISRNILHRIIWRHCAKLIEPFTEKFYGVTPLRCDFLKNVYNISKEKIELLELGADDERINFTKRWQIRRSIREMNNISENDFVLVTGGKISQSKNIHLLMQAVIELSNDNIKLIIFGTSTQQMRPTIENLSKSSCIRNIGWIDSNLTYDYFLASDLAVFPGTHSVLWEQSVGTGLPGIFKYWKGIDHVDLGGNCKFLYYDQVNEIKNVVEEIINQPDEFEKMKKVAEELGISKFSYKEISKRAIQF